MRRQDLTSPAAASIVIVDYEIGKRTADIDAERIFAHLPIKVLRCISSSSRSTAGFDRQVDADLPVWNMLRSSASAPAHSVELSVGAHRGHVRHAVRQREKSGDAGDIPDVLLVEAMGLQQIEIGLAHGVGRTGDLECEDEHRLLALRD